MDMKNKKNLKNFKKVCAVSSHITAKPYIIYKRENITFRELLIK